MGWVQLLRRPLEAFLLFLPRFHLCRKQLHLHVWCDQGTQGQDSEDAGRSSDQPSGGKNPTHDQGRVNQGARRPANQIEDQKAPALPELLHERPEEVERNHVEDQVRKPVVEKLEGKNPPDLKSLQGRPDRKGPEPHHPGLLEEDIEEEDPDVENQQPLHHRRTGQARNRPARAVTVVVAVCISHGRQISSTRITPSQATTRIEFPVIFTGFARTGRFHEYRGRVVVKSSTLCPKPWRPGEPQLLLLNEDAEHPEICARASLGSAHV